MICIEGWSGQIKKCAHLTAQGLKRENLKGGEMIKKFEKRGIKEYFFLLLFHNKSKNMALWQRLNP